jgi:hypothetical protein
MAKNVMRGLHRILIAIALAVAVGLLFAYPAGVAWQDQEVSEAHAQSDVAFELEQKAARYGDADTVFAESAHGQAKLARMVSDVLYENIPTLGYTAAISGAAIAGCIYLAGGFILLVGRWAWSGFSEA